MRRATTARDRALLPLFARPGSFLRVRYVVRDVRIIDRDTHPCCVRKRTDDIRVTRYDYYVLAWRRFVSHPLWDISARARDA
jgi:hypothetical protein